MADRVHPSAKPAPPPAAAAAAGSSFPAPKAQMYQRPIYRPAAPAKKRRRSCRCSLCCCVCWFLLAVILLALVAAVAGGAFYLLYRPQRPSFTVSAVRLTTLNLTSPSSSETTLTSSVTLTLTARNPNKKVVYVYDDLTLTAATAGNGVPLGTATVPGFAHMAGNTTVLAATLAADAVAVDPAAAGSDIKRSGSFSVVLDAETRAGVRVGSLKTKKIGIQVRCEGVKVTVPPKKKPAVAVTTKKLVGKPAGGKNGTALLAPAPAPASDADAETTSTATVGSTAAHSCTVRVRVKILRWTF
jgi:hypothetical protein